MANEKLKSKLSKFINKETILYIVFGVLTTLVNFVVYAACNYAFKDVHLENYRFLYVISFGKPYLLSNIIAWIVAVIFAFITNKLFVFESKSMHFKTVAREFISFILARLFSLLVEQLGLYLLVDTLLQKEFISKVIISIIVVIINYFLSKVFIFKKVKEKC